MELIFMELRDYQKSLLNKLHRFLKQYNKVLLQAPTGAGKTVMVSAYVKLLCKSNIKSLVVTNRLETLNQFGTTMMNDGIDFGIIHGTDAVTRDYDLVTLSTIQTLYKRELDVDFDYIFFDEIHEYYNKKMYNKLTLQYPHAKIIALTATPITEKGWLLPDFDIYINDVQISDLIKDGYLCSATTYINNDFDLDTKLLQISRGEYVVDDVERYTTTQGNMKIVYDEWCKYGKDKKTIFFCSSIDQAKQYQNYFKFRGVHCKVISSNSYYHERTRAIREFKEGIVTTIFNVNILTTGFDEPSVEIIGLLNPTRILRKYIQCCGRGLRPAFNKQQCIILDFVKNYQMHGDIADIRHYSKAPEKVRYKDCPECGLIVESHVHECPQCGYDFTVQTEKGTSKLTYSQMQSLEKAYNYQQRLIGELSDVIKQRGHRSGYLFYLLKDILQNKPQSQTIVGYYISKLHQLNAVREKNYKLNYMRYNHGKYAEKTFGVSNTDDVSPVVSKERFYNALMARTQRTQVVS